MSYGPNYAAYCTPCARKVGSVCRPNIAPSSAYPAPRSGVILCFSLLPPEQIFPTLSSAPPTAQLAPCQPHTVQCAAPVARRQRVVSRASGTRQEMPRAFFSDFVLGSATKISQNHRKCRRNKPKVPVGTCYSSATYLLPACYLAATICYRSTAAPYRPTSTPAPLARRAEKNRTGEGVKHLQWQAQPSEVFFCFSLRSLRLKLFPHQRLPRIYRLLCPCPPPGRGV